MKFTSGSTSEKHFICEGITRTYCSGDTSLAIETSVHRQVNTIQGKEFDMFDSTSDELGLVFPASVEYLVWIYGRLAKETLVSPVIDRHRILLILTNRKKFVSIR